MIGSSARPFSVSAYSTRGGTSGKVARATIPSSSSARRRRRERARADAGERALELAEARAALGEIADEQQCPLAADDVGGTADGTALVDRHAITLPTEVALTVNAPGPGGRPRRRGAQASRAPGGRPPATAQGRAAAARRCARGLVALARIETASRPGRRSPFAVAHDVDLALDDDEMGALGGPGGPAATRRRGGGARPTAPRPVWNGG